MAAMNPRLLLLEDDPVSAAFLRQALAALPAEVTHAGTLAAARRLADADQSLWLFDARLPDGHGGELLQELRGRGLRVPALALTAEDQPEALDRLRQSGFVRVLAKPVSAGALQAAVREWLPAPDPGWDDAMALSALGGSRQAVDALRDLFLAELPDQARDISLALAQGDQARAQAQLHRLKASCGFVGATALLRSVQALSRQPADENAYADFRAQIGAFAPVRVC
jgi:CheY-like chemotaxis protein/HPt (histidine-containing phosphotransfer) domain-containing protein